MKPTNRYIVLLRAIFVVTATGSMLTGCDTLNGLFASDRINYQNAESGPTLSVPTDLTPQKSSQRFAMPSNTALLGNPVSPTSTAEQQTQHQLHVEYDGNAYWLVASDSSPEKLWPQLETLWEKSGFTLTADQPEFGLMETSWTENRARVPHSGFRKTVGQIFESVYSSGTRDKFRTLVQRRANGTAISIIHHGMEEVVIGRHDSSRWQDRAREPNLELAFLTRLMESLGLSKAQAQNLIDQAQQAARATVIVNEQANATLIALDEPFERVWWRVGLALDRLNFAIDQRDKSKGLYGGRLAEENKELKKSSLLNKFFNRRGQTQLTSASYLIRIQSVNQTKTQVAVITENGQIDNTPAARQLILALHNELN